MDGCIGGELMRLIRIFLTETFRALPWIWREAHQDRSFWGFAILGVILIWGTGR